MSDERILYNSNALLSGKGTYGSGYIYEHAYGIKTGYTDSAGYCLVSAAKNNDMNLICVVLGCSSKTRTDGSTQFCNFSDTINLYQWVFENYKYHKVCTVEDLVAQATVKYAAADGNTVNLRPEKEVSVLAPASIKDDAFTSDIKIYSDVTAPVDAGQVLGTMEVKMNGKAVATVNLVAVTSVDMSQSQYFKDHIHSTFSNIWVKIVFWLLIILIGAYVALVVRYRLRRQRHLRDQRRARQAREKAREKAAAERLFRDSGGSGRMDTYRPGDYPGPRPVPRGGVDSTQKDYFDDFFRREEETEKKKK
jgi:D-alanyl-D-alanine carboxypeptidase (penicillin-binding protein 5/6)